MSASVSTLAASTGATSSTAGKGPSQTTVTTTAFARSSSARATRSDQSMMQGGLFEEEGSTTEITSA